MKATLVILASLSILSGAFADEASSRKTAESILEATGAAASMKAGFVSSIQPMIANMKKQGLPDAAGDEISAAMGKWFDTEIKWENIKPKMIDLYVKEFTEQDLKELLAFYQSPIGRKSITKLPIILQKGSVIGQEYFTTKQDSLRQTIQPIVEKYRPKSDSVK